MPLTKPFYESNEKSMKYVSIVSFIVVSYLFSIFIRMIWVYQFSDTEMFYWNDQLMINTNDGYFFAEGARDILSSDENINSSSPITQALSVTTAYLTKILPFSFETILLYLPAFLGSLLVVPLVLIGQLLKQPLTGFIAALIGSVAWSYYNRTMIGYYDTDMLNIVLPMVVLWSLLFAVSEHKNRYLGAIVFFLIISEWWYPKNVALNTAMVFMVFVYTFIYKRENLFLYKILLFSLIGLTFAPVYLKVLITVGLFLLFHFKPEYDKKTVFPLLVGGVIFYLSSGAFGQILSSFNLYIVNRLFADELPQLMFFDVINTVREAGSISFETFANRISGSLIGFILGTVGVVMIIIRYPIMIISLPMLAMGFMAYKAGLRFTVYALPIYALGLAYVVTFSSQYLQRYFDDRSKQGAKYIFIVVFSALLLYPNIDHIIKYKVPTVFNKEEAKVLDRLRTVASRDDYVVSWWDYGYPLRYYSDVNTLVDGGMHTGELNFPVSYALLNNQISAANISRLDVEYAAQGKSRQSIKHYMKDNGFVDPNDFLLAIDDKQFKLPAKSRDVYFYLPFRMLDILPTVGIFGLIDLTTGEKKIEPFFYQSQWFKEDNEKIDFGRNVVLDKKTSMLKLGAQDIPVKRFISVGYKDGKLQRQEASLHPASNISIIYMRDYKRMLIVDDFYYNSTYIQLFVFENYDKELFEPVIFSPYAKVYKLKR